MSKATSKKSKSKAATKPKQRRGEPVALKTPDFLAEQAKQIRQILPHVFTEGKIDVEKLRAALGDSADERPERYSFTWAGKRAAIQELQKPTWGTLVPAKNESINFDTTQNIFIEGENLEVLKLLYKAYFGRVKMIYIDPPYNTGGKDLIYPDDFADAKDGYLRVTGQKDAEGNLLTSNPESSGRYHSAWLSMMYPRLFLARQLLREDGVIFVSIDDHEVHNLRLLMNELFGEENFVAQINLLCNPKGRSQDKYFATNHEYVLVYSRKCLPKGYFSVAKDEDQIEAEYPEEDDGGKFRLLELRNTHREFGKHNRKNLYYPIYTNDEGEVFLSPSDGLHKVLPHWDDGYEGCWTWDKDKAKRDLDFLCGQKVEGRWKIYRKSYASGADRMLKTILIDKTFYTERGQKEFNKLFNTREKIFQSPKSPHLLAALIQTVTDDSDIVLDFFGGSGSAAQAVFNVNAEDNGRRRFVLVQLPETTGRKDYPTIAEIAKERLRRVVKKLAKERDDDLLLSADKTRDIGFSVFKLALSNFKPWVNEPDASPEKLAKAMELAFTRIDGHLGGGALNRKRT
jgi:adenine-specific DNA-methyltransferase